MTSANVLDCIHYYPWNGEKQEAQVVGDSLANPWMSGYDHLMSPHLATLHRRYEILLPRCSSDGKPIPDAVFADSLAELLQRFGPDSSDTRVLHSRRDGFVLFLIDVPDDVESRDFFHEFTERLKVRFQQIDIFMTTYPVEVI